MNLITILSAIPLVAALQVRQSLFGRAFARNA